MIRRIRVGTLAGMLLMLALVDVACSGESTPVTPTTTTTTTTTTSTPTVTLTPTTLAFASTSTGVQTVVLTNTGTAALEIAGLTTSGNFMATNDCPSTVPAGATCEISVTFMALAATFPSASSGSVSITDNAASSPQSVVLSGPPVTTATAILTPGSLAFGTQVLGSTSGPQTVTLTNPLNGAATLALAVRSIAADGDFQIVQTSCGSSLPAGGSCAVSVVFAPTATGARAGRLIVVDDAPISISVIALSGSSG
ncbi:MAG: choice-of-anchor D domain-containing protein [Acidobacteriota bacterium]